MNFDSYFETYKNEIISKTQTLIRIPSVFSQSNNLNAPFGQSILDSLTYMLELGKSLGFTVKNIDNYCGYIEFGEGDLMLRDSFTFRCSSCWR